MHFIDVFFDDHAQFLYPTPMAYQIDPILCVHQAMHIHCTWALNLFMSYCSQCVRRHVYFLAEFTVMRLLTPNSLRHETLQRTELRTDI